MKQITTFSLLRYEGLQHRAWAFAQMGLNPVKRSNVSGLQFSRLLGSGAGNGFSWQPNWGVYAWLGHWDDQESAEIFFKENPWWKEAKSRQAEQATFFLHSSMCHGKWGGEQPFSVNPDLYDPTQPVAVITRATIRPVKLPDFWRYVSATSQAVYEHSSRLLSIGVGEYPIFMQATFSVWESGSAMQDFAYRDKHHSRVIKYTRERNWYKEELFCRFSILSAIGTWNHRTASDYIPA